MPKPNILYIHSHDTGRYLQPYGHAIPTPRLQLLAENGVLFRQAFCAAPTCSASRAALLTGQASHSAGMYGLTGIGFTLRDAGQHLVHTLRAAGYVSAQCGVQHVSLDPHSVGYDFVLPHPSPNEVRHVAPVAVQWIREAPTDRPFFLDVGFLETHRYQREPENGAFTRDGPHGDNRYVLPPAYLPDTPATRQDMADFIESARILDDGVAQVFDALEQAGLLENTLVISTTDHGIAFPDMKCNLLDGGLGVSLIMAGPGGFKGGQVVDALVSHIDVFPTLCDLLEIERPEWLQGQSLLPLVRGEAKEINEAIFGEVTFHGLYDPQRCVRTRRWKYIRRFEDYPAPGQAVSGNTDMGLSKKLWVEHGWRERTYAREQLYDLVFDPNEADNLAASPAHSAILDEMRARLECWMRETGDLLLDGPVPLPPGVPEVFNDDGIRRGLPLKFAVK